jgi:hypothetical protein
VDKHLLVVDRFSVIENTPRGVDDDLYRLLVLSGATYTEQSYRQWVARIWSVSPDLPLSELATVAARGGWVTYVMQ